MTVLVSFSDVFEVNKDCLECYFDFVSVILISLILDKVGLFEWSAIHMLHASSKRQWFKNVRLYHIIGVPLLLQFRTDGAALILTPIVLAMVKNIGFSKRRIPFYYCEWFYS
ncbi:ArsB/NhaD family transporter [Staphylococcus aureus]